MTAMLAFSAGRACVSAARADAFVPLRKVLLIVHRRDAQPGNVGLWLKARGFSLDIRCPREGDPLPPTLAAHAGVVVFGGPMSANDPDDYIREEIRWLAVPLKEEKPYFGICLGAQMLAKHLGGHVGHHAEGHIEAGYFRIQPSAAGTALMEWPSHVYEWHNEGFTLPPGAECLAMGGTFENQAYRYGPRAFGVQFHPEMTLGMIHRWTTLAATKLRAPGGKPPAEHIAGHLVHGDPQRAWLSRFMSLWLDQPVSA